MNARHSLLALGSSLLLCSLSLAATRQEPDAGVERWPSFRGEAARGVVERPAPTEWDPWESQNILWRQAIPGLAHSSPVVWGERVFVTTAEREEAESELASLYGSPGYGAGDSVEDEGAHAFRVLCFDATSGELLWSRCAYEGVPKVKRHPKSTHANPTPACDGQRVVAFFGSEGLYCYDHAGELLWKRDFGVLEAAAPDVEDSSGYQWGFASSPILHEGQVFVQCDVQGQSFVAALDAKTGEDLWRVERDENSTWCTPTVCPRGAGGEQQLVLNGYKHTAGYDLASGRELWTLAGGGDVPVPSPIVAHDLIYLTSAHGRLAPIHAISVEAKGTLSMDPETCEGLVWSHPRKGNYMQTLLAVADELYSCSDGGVLSCFDAKSGEPLYRERLGDGTTGFSASGVAAGGVLYYSGESGEVYLVKAGREFELLGVRELGDACMATPAIAHGRLYFRTAGSLIAIGS